MVWPMPLEPKWTPIQSQPSSSSKRSTQWLPEPTVPSCSRPLAFRSAQPQASHRPLSKRSSSTHAEGDGIGYVVDDRGEGIAEIDDCRGPDRWRRTGRRSRSVDRRADEGVPRLVHCRTKPFFWPIRALWFTAYTRHLLRGVFYGRTRTCVTERREAPAARQCDCRRGEAADRARGLYSESPSHTPDVSPYCQPYSTCRRAGD